MQRVFLVREHHALGLLVLVAQGKALDRRVSVNDRQGQAVSNVPVVRVPVRGQGQELAVSVRRVLAEHQVLLGLTSVPTAPLVAVALAVAVAPVVVPPVLLVAVVERAKRASPSAPREQSLSSEKLRRLVASASPVAMARQ